MVCGELIIRRILLVGKAVAVAVAVEARADVEVYKLAQHDMAHVAWDYWNGDQQVMLTESA